MSRMKLPQIIAAAVTAAVLGTAGVSVAGAVGGTGGSSPAVFATQSATQATTTAAPAAGASRVRRALRGGLALAAQTIGITPKALRAELKSGKSIADVATAHSVPPKTVINTLITAGDKRIENLKDSGKISAARAARLEQKLPVAVTKLVNAKGGVLAKGVKRLAIGKAAIAVAAQTIGIKPAALRTELRAGHTIASVAGAHSVQPQAVIDALVKAGDTKIEHLQSAGTISAARAATLEQKLPGRAATFVNTWLPKHHA
jgi:hypothetical protein